MGPAYHHLWPLAVSQQIFTEKKKGEGGGKRGGGSGEGKGEGGGEERGEMERTERSRDS